MNSKNKKKIIIILIILLSVFYFISTPIYNNKITTHKNQTLRVATLSSDMTEIIFTLKKQNVLVGRTSACNYIKGVKNIPIVGNIGIPNIEKLLVANPTIVITSMYKDISTKNIIENFGIKFYKFNTSSIKEYLNIIKQIGIILNVQNNAKKEIIKIITKLQHYKKKYNNTLHYRPTVFLMLSYSPLMTIGKTSFLNDYIYYAGGINVTSHKRKNYLHISKEELILLNPDIIIAPNIPNKIIINIKNDPLLNTISAVKNNKIYNKINKNLLYVISPTNLLHAIKELNKYITQYNT